MRLFSVEGCLFCNSLNYTNFNYTLYISRILNFLVWIPELRPAWFAIHLDSLSIWSRINQWFANEWITIHLPLIFLFDLIFDSQVNYDSPKWIQNQKWSCNTSRMKIIFWWALTNPVIPFDEAYFVISGFKIVQYKSYSIYLIFRRFFNYYRNKYFEGLIFTVIILMIIFRVHIFYSTLNYFFC